MNDTLKIQLHQEAKKMAGTGRGNLFESALERISELERQQSEVAARAVEGAVSKYRIKVLDGPDIYSEALLYYANQLRKGEGDDSK